MQLFLIRHPAPQVAPGTCYGRSDLPLAADVTAAAARIAPQLPGGLTLYTSPLQRCRLLADALHPMPVRDARLQEMDFGEWELTPWQAIQREALDGWAADPLGYAPPGGESVAALQARVHGFVTELRGLGIGAATLVTHAGVIKALAGLERRLPPREWMSLAFAYESVTCITLD